MNYFRINHSIDLKEVGKYPQAQHPVDVLEKRPEDPFLTNFSDIDKLPDNVFSPIHALEEKAKLTDLVSYVAHSSYGLIISEKLKNVLLPHIDNNAQFINSPVFYKHELQDYSLLHFYVFSFYNLDFQRSEIWKMKSLWDKESMLQLKNDNDLLLAIEKYQYPLGVKIDQVVIKTDVSEHFFTLHHVYGGVGYYVSEKLKNAIEQAGCTGLRFLGVNEKP